MDVAGGAKTARIEALDILRGIAVLGIMLMNVWAMGSVPGVDSDPRIAGWSALDQAAFWFQSLFVEGTMRGLLSMLFGAGFVIIATRPPRGGQSAFTIYYRRTLLLVLFGLVHGFLLMWPGDILLVYGLAGLLLFPFRDLAPRALIGAGIGCIALLTAIGAAGAIEGLNVRAHANAAVAAGAADDDARIAAWQGYVAATRPDFETDAESLAARRGSLAANLRYKFAMAVAWNDAARISWWMLDAGAFMLLGAGLYKLGVLSGALDRKIYAVIALAGYAVGVALNAAETWQLVASDFVVPIPISEFTYQTSRLATTIGHAGLVLACLKTVRGHRALGMFAPAGRMALSNYVGQTLITQWLLFPGFALGLHGKLSLAELMGVAALIAAAQIAFSAVWLRRFAMGPLEWLWRWLTYRQRPAFRLA